MSARGSAGQGGQLDGADGHRAGLDEEWLNLRKRLTSGQVREAVSLLRKHGIVSQWSMMIGTRQDDGRSIMRKLDFLKRLDVDFPVFTIYTPFLGTEVFQDVRVKMIKGMTLRIPWNRGIWSYLLKFTVRQYLRGYSRLITSLFGR